jgi:hypothetical protein
MSDTDEQRKQDEEADVEGHLRRLNEQDGEGDDQAPDVDVDVEGHMRKLNEQDGEDDDQAPDVDVEGHLRR